MWCGKPDSERSGSARHGHVCHPRREHGSEHRYCRSTGTFGWDRRSPQYSPAWVLPAGVSPHSRDVQEEALAQHPTREVRRDDKRSNRLGFVASADGGACCAWLLLVRKEVEEGTSPDAKVALEKIEGRLRAGTRIRTHEAPSESSLLKIGSRVSFLEKQG